MSRASSFELLAEAAGVRIVTSSPKEDANGLTPGKMILKMPRANGKSDNSFGFHLTKSKWDPFPWVSYIENGSLADLVGLRTGDCFLSVDGIDLLGLRLADIATLIRSEQGANYSNIAVWRRPVQEEAQDDIGLALKGPLPDVTKNLVSALSGTIRVLECPICLETAAPPVSQCVHGHILCVVCRPKMTRCPVCRARLGQGRCLLADNLHRVLRDTYLDGNSSQTEDSINVAPDHCSLHDRLIGKTKKQEETLTVTKSNRDTLKPRQFLLARLLLGGREKAVSADNLTSMSEIGEEIASVPDRTAVANSLLRLSLNDRAKSASTGELSKDKHQVPRIDSPLLSQTAGLNQDFYARCTASQQSLGAQQTPIFSGSMESVSAPPLACPLLRLCNELVTCHTLLEHIKSHRTPQIHFHSRHATIPLPIPFGPDAFYVLHHDSCMFFFQCGDDAAWMTCPTTMACANETEWTLHAWADSGSEIYLRRYVAYLEDPVTLSSQHIAPLPSSLSLRTINVRIAEPRVHERFDL